MRVRCSCLRRAINLWKNAPDKSSKINHRHNADTIRTTCVRASNGPMIPFSPQLRFGSIMPSIPNWTPPTEIISSCSRTSRPQQRQLFTRQCPQVRGASKSRLTSPRPSCSRRTSCLSMWARARGNFRSIRLISPTTPWANNSMKIICTVSHWSAKKREAALSSWKKAVQLVEVSWTLQLWICPR